MKRVLLHSLLSILLLGSLPVFAQDEGTTDDSAVDQDADRITFDVRLSPERGGGRVTGWAGNIELKEGQSLLATDGVELKYRDLVLQADLARVDIPTNLLTAEGNVILDEGPQRLTGDTLEYDLSTRTGRVTQATAYVDPDYYFSGSQIAKTGEKTFTINDGVFTSCEQDVPSWSIHLRDARVTLDEYAHIKHARLKFKRLPVLYSPYLLWPATTERTSGFLVPRPGYSSRQGAHLSMAYYKVLGRSADTTFFADLSTKEYFGFGNEIRYRPSEDTEGYFRAHYLFEPEDVADEFFNNTFSPDREKGDDRWKIEFHHESKNLWGKFRGVVNFKEYSDFDYLRDFERDVRRQTNPVIYSNAFLTRNEGNYSFNILIDQRERILSSGNEDLRRQLPELEFRLRPTRLGNTPLYFSLESSVNYLSIKQTNVANDTVTLDGDYGRAFVAPKLSIPVSTLPWLSAKLELGGHATYYTDTLAIDADDNVVTPRAFAGDSRDRILPRGNFEVVGPVFSKIFEKGSGRFSKFKHIIEPRITYSYLEIFDEQDSVFNFDEIDTLNFTNGVTVALINRLMAKPSDPEEGSAIEVASFEVRRGYSFDEELPLQGDQKEGPIRAILRVNPSRQFSIRTDARYDTINSRFRSLQFTGDWRFGGTPGPRGPIGGHRLGLTLRTTWDAMGETTQNQLRLNTRFSLFRNRLTFDSQISINLDAPMDTDRILQQRYFLKWQAQCYDWQLEYRESTYRGIEENDLLFSLSLKNVGTFLDLNESI